MTRRILAIDGGGIRGIIPARILSHVEQAVGQPIAALFDVIAGTSTGGILACGLTVPGPRGQPNYTAQDLLSIYVKEGKHIFPHEFFSSGMDLLHQKYPSDGIESFLHDYFGDCRLKDVLSSVLVTSYDIERRKPFFFRSAKAKMDESRDFPLWKVARSTSAAPTYFEPYLLASETSDEMYALVDGGVFANNPAMCAYVDACSGPASGEDTLLLSLGTGCLTSALEYQRVRHWGIVEWARPALNVVFDGVSETTEYELAQLLAPGSYYRVQGQLDIASDHMDNVDAGNLDALQRQADKILKDNEATLSEVCSKLRASYLVA